MNALRRLAQPPASFPVLDRRRANLLAWRLLVMILLLVVLFGIAFGLLRAGYYQYSAALTILCAVCGPWGSLTVDPTVLERDFGPLTYVVISILLSSILMHPLFTGFLASLQLIASIASAVPIHWPSLLAMVFFILVLSILANIISQRDLERIEQQTRQLELDSVQQFQLLEEARRRINSRYCRELRVAKHLTRTSQLGTACIPQVSEALTPLVSRR